MSALFLLFSISLANLQFVEMYLPLKDLYNDTTIFVVNELNIQHLEDLLPRTTAAASTPPPPPMPFIIPGVPRNITVAEGTDVELVCHIYNLTIQSVSWIRLRDMHILTVGTYTYTTDQRFNTTKSETEDRWTLHVSNTKKTDSGMYECQLNTQPITALTFTLNVLIPVTSISGGPDLHVSLGTNIVITCLIQETPTPPATITWYHNNKYLNYDTDRGGVSVITEKSDVTTSHLIIQRATREDSGNYVCRPSNLPEARAIVHILDEESPAAMQTASATISNFTICLLSICLLQWSQISFL